MHFYFLLVCLVSKIAACVVVGVVACVVASVVVVVGIIVAP